MPYSDCSSCGDHLSHGKPENISWSGYGHSLGMDIVIVIQWQCPHLHPIRLVTKLFCMDFIRCRHCQCALLAMPAFYSSACKACISLLIHNLPLTFWLQCLHLTKRGFSVSSKWFQTGEVLFRVLRGGGVDPEVDGLGLSLPSSWTTAASPLSSTSTVITSSFASSLIVASSFSCFLT